jgi:enamine deaminase RidA (YjgF/YER057c/UK114 family)
MSGLRPLMETAGTWLALGAIACVSGLLGAPAAHAQARTPETVIMTEHPEGRRIQDEWGFADAVIAGDTIYLSGIVVVLPPGQTDMEAAYDRVYRRIGRILERAGSSFADVVDITSYHTDVVAQMPAIIAVQRRYIQAPPPAWTAIDIDRLIPEHGITEIKITARRSDAARTQAARRSRPAASSGTN